MSPAERFVERFENEWRQLDPARFVEALYHPDATLRQPGMERPIGRDEMVAHAARLQALLPDIRLSVLGWAARDDLLLIEWRIRATLGGEPLEWEGVDRFVLRGDRAIDEVVYFDRLPLWARLGAGIDARYPGT